MSDLPALIVTRKTGDEPLHDAGRPLGPALIDFWRWSASDLINNTTRGILAEYLVASALDLATGVRSTWDAHDLTTATGLRIEVKSSAYVQAWAQKSLSKITFSIAETQAWDALTGTFGHERKRQADVYVFCLLHHQVAATLDPLDVAHWTFYIVPTRQLNATHATTKRISLHRVLALGATPLPYHQLANTLRSVE